ncbi:MAG: ATP-dependent DNA helicase RecG [Agathobacter sp.]|nr:ATP-dependent DNA helicase RecG [Agathobacter sp.]
MQLTSSITSVKGIGEKTAQTFEKMNIYTVEDVLFHFPRNYFRYPIARRIEEIEVIQEGMTAIRAVIKKTPMSRNARSMNVTTLTIGETPKKLELVWFRMPYVKNSLQFGREYVFFGKMVIKNKRWGMEQPTIYEVAKYEAIEGLLQPVYGLTSGVTNNLITKTMKTILSDMELILDYIPADIRKRYGLCEYNYALKQIHFPDTMDSLIDARRCLVFHEFFLFLMGIQYQKEKKSKDPNGFSFKQDSFVQDCIAKLPYPLTNAQKKALQDIEKDMNSPYVMQRLVQGDVGSGKTIVAFLAMARVAHSGYQSAIMAPTEVLARQHFETYQKLCRDFGLDFPVVLLTGSMKAKEKREAYAKLEACPNALVIGTHALIQEKAVYSNLALVITDEQHRFGVKQRDVFSEKGIMPHVLVMSATPIPRTLAIIIYGDMDISVIDEVPAKRLPIKNCVVDVGFRPKAYDFIINQVNEGHQAYVICPLVEDTENMEGKNATDYAKELEEILPSHIKVGLLHGKMKNDKKNEVMEAYARNEIQVLVSTTVVEVGVNVPNATVMMIENADHFGLAQLHQLRGRVGRGDAQSYCIMINTSSTKTAKKRLEILNKSNDGFYIASEDLKLRGPGDFFGVRQSGDLAFDIGDIYQDAKELQQASESVKEILDNDPELIMEEHAALKREMQKFIDEQIKKMTL